MVPLEQYLNRYSALLLLFIFGCIDLDSKEVKSFNVEIFKFHSKNGIFSKIKLRLQEGCLNYMKMVWILFIYDHILKESRMVNF